jgi:Biotin/lipoate A/B protein ligase family
MPPNKHGLIPKLHWRPLDLPPAFRPVRLREAGDAFAYACGNATTLGAGTLVFVGRFGISDFAVILEPEEPLRLACRTVYAGMAALYDALAALAPPEKPIAIEWPDAVLIDRGLIGGGRLGWPEGCGVNAPPDWLVFGVSVRTVFVGATETGLHPNATALEGEGFGEASPERVAEGFARHFMLVIDRWQEVGFEALAKEFLPRLRFENAEQHLSLSPSGDLAIRGGGRMIERRNLLSALKTPSWLDVATGEPRL